jgi:hypothetical protein
MTEGTGEEPVDIPAETAAIEERLEMIQSALSQHMGELVETGATKAERDEVIGIRRMLGEISVESRKLAETIEPDVIPQREIVVEPDPTITEDEKFEIALRFVERQLGVPFTLSDLEMRLRRNGVILPEKARPRRELLEDYLDEIMAILNEGDEEFTRVDQRRRGKESLIAVAKVGAPAIPAVEPQLEMIAAENPAVPTKPAPQQNKETKKQKKSPSEILSDTDKTDAKAIVAILAATEDITQLLSTAQILQEAKHRGLDLSSSRGDINRIARQLRNQGITTFGNKKGKGHSQFKIGLASSGVRAAGRSQKGKWAIDAAIDSGTPFLPDEK